MRIFVSTILQANPYSFPVKAEIKYFDTAMCLTAKKDMKIAANRCKNCNRKELRHVCRI